MKNKLTRIGDDLAVVLDEPLLNQVGLDENSEVEISINDDVVVITPVRDVPRAQKLHEAIEKMDKKYAGLFRRLAE
jgi:antitoxin component of MazEF toxin-antitoxin module